MEYESLVAQVEEESSVPLVVSKYISLAYYSLVYHFRKASRETSVRLKVSLDNSSTFPCGGI